MNNESNPRSSRARPSASGLMPSSVMNVATPNLIALSYRTTPSTAASGVVVGVRMD